MPNIFSIIAFFIFSNVESRGIFKKIKSNSVQNTPTFKREHRDGRHATR